MNGDINKMPDLRSPLVKAWDEWIEGDEARMLIQVAQPLSPIDEFYITNRFERAFLAGAKAQAAIMEQGDE